MELSYIGSSPLRGMGGACWSVAYRPDTDTYFTIGGSGKNPFTLYEFSPVWGADAVLVKTWGPINDSADRLGVVGKELVQFTSLEWDAERGGLWGSYGSHYSVPESVPSFLVFIEIAQAGMFVFGPWNCPAGMVGRMRGGVMSAPLDVQVATGYDSMTFGPRSSGSGSKSWGPGVVMFDRPDPFSVPPKTVVPAQNVIDWPMVATKVGPRAGDVSYSSACPVGGGTLKWIIGNNSANSAAVPPKPSYETNVIVAQTTFSEIVGVLSMTVIDDQVVYLFRTAPDGAYTYYGHSGSHSGTTENDIAWGNSIDSVIKPGQKVVGANPYKGYQAEKYILKLASVPLQAVVDAEATGTPQKVPWGDFINLQDVLGSYQMASLGVSQITFNPASRTLYLLETGDGGTVSQLHAFQVSSPCTKYIDQIAVLQSQVDLLNGTISNLQAEIGGLQNVNSGLAAQLQAMQADNALLQTQVVDLSASLETLTTQLNELNDAIDRAQGQK